MPKRGQGFSTDETEYLLDQIEKILPLGNIAWERVLVQHEIQFSSLNRNVKSLQRKFATLYNYKIPTGDPNCPDQVRRAKRLYQRINEKMDVATGAIEGLAEGEDSDDDYDDDAGDDDSDRSNGDDNGDEVLAAEGDEGGREEREKEQQNTGDDVNTGTPSSINVDVNQDSTVASRASSRNSHGRSQMTTHTRSRQGSSSTDKDAPANKVRRTSAFSTPIIHTRRRTNQGTTPGTGVTNTSSGAMFNDMMQMMMMQNEVERSRREAEDMRHRQMMDMFMVYMMGNMPRNPVAAYGQPTPMSAYVQPSTATHFGSYSMNHNTQMMNGENLGMMGTSHVSHDANSSTQGGRNIDSSVQGINSVGRLFGMTGESNAELQESTRSDEDDEAKGH
mmetsp:Transcript_8792/g.16591  ORF Transcript_8792/g.16591 Transcript_8792/m.16591 type:complete len:390 (-) Transcript_8792:43-1212(-)